MGRVYDIRSSTTNDLCRIVIDRKNLIGYSVLSGMENTGNFTARRFPTESSLDFTRKIISHLQRILFSLHLEFGQIFVPYDVTRKYIVLF